MKLSMLASRDDAATKQIVAATEKLVAHFGLSEDVLTNVQTQRGTPPVRAMMQREAVASLLEAVVAALPPKADEQQPETAAKPRRSAKGS